jgi:ribonuclease-3 family protein
MDVRNINVLVLAYLGDTIYEYYVRKQLINKYSNVNDLQSNSIKYVSAKGQKKYVLDLIEENFFSDEELDVIKRARNNTSSTHPKNCDIVTYKYATGLEALIGYLELTNRRDRIEEIMNKILGDE